MFAIGVPKTQYRRTHDVLSHSKSDPVNYYDEKQDDGFYMFYFPEMDEENFSRIVKILKNNGVTTIGADSQLTEKKIMKLADLYKSLNDKPLHEQQNTTSGEFDVEVPVQNEMEKVKIKYGQATGPVDDVTISWGNESHNVDFEAEDVIDDHGNEGKDMIFVAYSQDDKWRFTVDVSVEANYENSGEIQDVDWDTLEITMEEGTMSDDDVDRAFTVDAPDRFSLQEQFQRLAGIKPLYEQGFDDRLKSAGGFSDEEMDDITSSDDTFFKDVFGDDDEEFEYGTSSKARKLITKLRQDYRNMSDEELDKFSVEMVEHFLDNLSAQVRAKTILTKRGIV